MTRCIIVEAILLFIWLKTMIHYHQAQNWWNVSPMQHNNQPEEQSVFPSKSNLVIPVIQEQVQVDKQWVETAKIVVRKSVSQEEISVDVPLTQETYRIEHVPVNRLVDTLPPVREEGNVTIIPVVREVVVKRYEIVEEVHVIREKKTTTEHREITLSKEEIQIDRKPLDGNTPS